MRKTVRRSRMKRVDSTLASEKNQRRRHWVDAGRVVIFVAAYVLLDWASYIHPLYGLNITPWNPAIALGLLLLLRSGMRGAAPLLIAIVIAEAWVRGLRTPIAVTVGLSVLLTGGYTAMGLLLRRRFPDGRI